MSTANSLHPPLRLLERPVRPAPMSRVAAPREPWGDWCVRQVERLWAWGEGARHHRMGSYTAH